MESNQLTKEHLPGFIYLTDQMLAYDFVSEEAETGNIYKIIADEGTGSNNGTISDRTIRRAFNLRKNLKKGKIVFDDYNRPEIKTLNTLTYFHYDKTKPTRFNVFEKEYKDKIKKYYKEHKPSDEIIELIFGNNPEKLSLLDKKKNSIENLLDKLVEDKFENLNNELCESNKRFEEFQKKMNDDIKLQNDMITYLKMQMEQVQKKRNIAAFVYRFFGSFGLFFVSIDYNELHLNNILEDFIDEYDGLDNDTLLDDLL